MLASGVQPLDVKVADVNGNGVPDVLALDENGVRVIYRKTPTLKPNDTPQTARNLGTVVHVVEPTLTLVPGHSDTYYTLTVPTEVVRGAGDEVLDFSGFFQAQAGAGLAMEVTDAAGNVLGSGERFRIVSKQGAVLTLHVFAKTAPDGSRGAGAYTLDINVLPQIVAVEAQPLLPGVGLNPGGPTTSLVLTFQGDRLDPATAENPANYTVTWLGPDGIPGTADDQVIPIQHVVYDPSTNLTVASGLVFPTAVRQTVTLVFASPLPAGAYQIELTPAIQTAAFNQDEPSLLADSATLAGHPVVALIQGQVTAGSRLLATDLVFAAGPLGDLHAFEQGTALLTQLHDDLRALLDAGLTKLGDVLTLTGALDNQIVDRLDPGLGTPSQRPIGLLVLWLDPGSFSLIDPQNKRLQYSLGEGKLGNQISGAYVNISSNVELVVLPLFRGSGGRYLLNVGEIAATARGSVILLASSGNQVLPLTPDLREGMRDFVVDVLAQAGLATSAPGQVVSRGQGSLPAAPSALAPAESPGESRSLTDSTLLATLARILASDSQNQAIALSGTTPIFLSALVGLVGRPAELASPSPSVTIDSGSSTDAAFPAGWLPDAARLLRALQRGISKDLQLMAAGARTVLWAPFGALGLQPDVGYWQDVAQSVLQFGISTTKAIAAALGSMPRSAQPNPAAMPSPAPIPDKEEPPASDEIPLEGVPLDSVPEGIDGSLATALVAASVCQAAGIGRPVGGQVVRRSRRGLHFLAP
jgi:hypothetical protein